MVVLYGLAGPKASREFTRAIRGAGSGERVHVDLSRVSQVFPNGAVPFAAALEHARQVRGLNVDLVQSAQVKRVKACAPLGASGLQRRDKVFNLVWRYDSDAGASRLTNAYVRGITEHVDCESGVVDSLQWCLFEVLDNVLLHAESGVGFAMMQIHTRSRRCVIAVADAGLGVHRSFALSERHRPSTAHEALKIATMKGVTSKESSNQGNGLYGLRRVVEINGGQLTLRSGRGWLTLRSGEETGGWDREEPLLGPDHHGASVDWQLDVASPVRIEEALGIQRPVESWLEKLEDADGQVVIDSSELVTQVGSRRGGKAVRVRVTNAARDSPYPICLDFEGIPVISSSFADELFGLMVQRDGEEFFRHRVRIRNASESVTSLIHRAMVLRGAQVAAAEGE